MKVALHGLALKPEFLPQILSLFSVLESSGVEIFVTDSFDKQLSSFRSTPLKYWLLESKEDYEGLDFFLSIGGDGTLLDSVCLIGSREIPILGLNTGRLGFLATVAKDKIEESVKNLVRGGWHI